ncbi:MAG: helix-turn-helix domain-containing protein [Nanoarchaeota archaeon]|nr:helix-turn-helix domain-containing protein [Nanoarchaeota archaeon]
MFNFFRLKEDTKSLRRHLNEVDQNIQQSFSNLKEDMKEIGKWIHHFNEQVTQKDKFIHHLEGKIDILETKIHEKEREHLHEKHVERSKIEHVQPFNRSVQPFMNVQPYVQPTVQSFEHMFNQQNKADLASDFKRLTPAQQRVIGLLAYSGGPMDYEEIAKRLNLNPITARRHINDVKRMGVAIKKKVSDNGRKNLYYLDEQVKQIILGHEDHKED